MLPTYFCPIYISMEVLCLRLSLARGSTPALLHDTEVKRRRKRSGLPSEVVANVHRTERESFVTSVDTLAIAPHRTPSYRTLFPPGDHMLQVAAMTTSEAPHHESTSRRLWLW